jgi:UDP-galactose transporter
VLSQLSKEADGTYAYSLPTVVAWAEIVKLCLSTGFLTKEKESFVEAVHLVVATPVKTWLLFAVPSVLYAINNNLDMLFNLYMDPATASVLCQLKVLTTALAHVMVFSRPLERIQWISLVVLTTGCAMAGWPSGGKNESTYIEPFGLVLMAMYVGVSGAAGVYNEWLYKGLGKDESIHICNIRIYVIGSLVCFTAHFLTSVRGNEGVLKGLFSGYNFFTFALLVNYSVLGLLIAQILKFFDSIVKLFISGSSMYASAILTVTVFHRMPSAMFGVGLVLVTIAVLMYNYTSIVEVYGKDANEKVARWARLRSSMFIIMQK